MARIFSIQFMYEGMLRSALVAFRPTPLAREYTVTQIGGDLQEELPSRKILATPAGQFAFVEHGLPRPTALMCAILKALDEHVKESA
ncbi:MAG: hypothetical protein JWP27_2934 [Flaviaesturariibacter sp.]|nr:hypothetical protein [Flaviaesturariibacter sp.]